MIKRLATLSLFATFPPSAADESKRPNVIVVMADDMPDNRHKAMLL